MAVSLDFLSNPIFVLGSFLVLFIFHNYIHKQPQHGKKYHPTAATLLQPLINYKKLHDYMTGLAIRYKTYRILSPFHGMIYTTDPVNVEYMLKTNFNNYGKGYYLPSVTSDLLGEGIFTVDGDKWREQRKVASQEFSTKILRDYSSVTFRNNTIKLGEILSQAADSNQIIDINDLFMKLTMDSIFKVGFGIDLDNLGGNEEGVRFSLAFDDANNLIYKRFYDPSWRIKKFFNIGMEAELKTNLKIVDDFVYKLIQTKIEQMQMSKDESLFKKDDILSRFVEVHHKNPKYLRDIILNFVLAGKDPIAISMSWLIYELCKHPEIQEKVAKEILEALNVKNEEITDVADFMARVSDTALEKMPYLHAALSESIRLYPALPMDPKVSFTDDVLPDGCNVNKGDVVTYMPYAMGRMKYIWGDDALEFKPERWLDQDGCYRPESPFKFTAFQAGPRTCLGRDFAYRHLKIIASVVLGCFAFKLRNEKEVMSYRLSINVHVEAPLQVYVSRRSVFQNP
ncbi:putative abieta-7,13-dien-18-ol hydroxylase [Helianthus debilis subsp. tardiflorus]